jgi:hypothetical protein
MNALSQDHKWHMNPRIGLELGEFAKALCA